MNIIIIAIIAFVAAILVTAFIDLKLSVALYISYLILVPYMEYNVGGISLSYNVVNTILLLAFIYKFRIRDGQKFNFEIVKPFFFLFGVLFLLTFVELDTPWDVQFTSIRASFMKTCILIFIVWNAASKDPKMMAYIKFAIIGSFTIACIYGLFLTQMGGDNPYTTMLASYVGVKKDMAKVFSESSKARLSFSTAGKIQATMVHPMTWGIHLCLIINLVMVYLVRGKKAKLGYLLFLGLLLFNILISGVRTGVASLIIAFFYYTLSTGRVKIALYSFGIAALTTIGVIANKDLRNIFTSFIDVSGTQSNIKGSSIAMRLDQMQGVFYEIRGVEWVGKGYGWTTYYLVNKGDHPILLAFESLIYVVMCNGGIIGTIVWIIFFIMLFVLNRKLIPVKSDVTLADTMIIIYLSYAIGTGEYGYIQVFALYYTFLILTLQNANIKKIKFQIWTEKHES